MGYDRTGSCRAATEPLHVEQLGLVEYRTAWDAQRAHAAARRDGTGPDVLMLLEHPPVYTAGKRTRPADRPDRRHPVVDVDRGGLITWHGPGQLVGYPLVALATPLDVVDYVRRLEEALIAVVTGMGLPGAGRVDGRTGVWLPADDRGPERKVAAIGVRVQGGVTMHGFALNCDPDLTWFDRIVPCGITDAGVTSLAVELGRHVSVDEMRAPTAAAVAAALDGALPVAEHAVTARGPPAWTWPTPPCERTCRRPADVALAVRAWHTSWDSAATRRPGLDRRELRRHLGGDQLEVVEVGQVEHLQVEAGDPGPLPPRPELVDDLGHGARRGRTARARRPCGRSPPPARATSASSRPDAGQLGHRADQLRRVAADARAGARRRARTAPRPSSTDANGTLNSVANRAASAGVRRLPLAADDHRRVRPLHRLGQGGRVDDRVVRAGERVPLPRRRPPQAGDDLQLLGEPVEALAQRRERDAVRPCSASNQPVPSPSSTRPPDIWSTCATAIASGPGRRKVAEVTSVPSRIRDVSRASPARVTYESVGPGSPGRVPIARKWSERKNASKPALLGRPRDAQQVVVGRPLLGLGEDPEVHARHM